MRNTLLTRTYALPAGLMLLIAPAIVGAQTSTPKWEVEIRGGYQAARTPTDGTSQLPPASPDFMYGGVTSRRVSSWYFGDGAKLLNDSLASLAGAAGIVPLDSVLTAAAQVRPSGRTFGFAIARRLTSRFAASLAVDVSNSAPRMTADTIAQIDKTRDSFPAAWTSRDTSRDSVLPPPVLPLPALYFVGKTEASTSDIKASGTRRVTLATGTLRTTIAGGRQFDLYATTGAGVGHHAANVSGFTLVGLNAFTAATSVDPVKVLGTFSESDSVTVRYAGKNSYLVGVLGAGVSAYLHRRQGIRLDVRFFLSGDSMDTFVSATPANVQGSPAFDFARANLVFSNNPATMSSLSLPLVDFKSRTGSGTVVQRLITVGYFVRF